MINPGLLVVRKSILKTFRTSRPPWSRWGDVESLYPYLKVEAVSKRMKETILESGMKWEDIDYMEAARYIAVSGEQCKVKNNAD